MAFSSGQGRVRHPEWDRRLRVNNGLPANNRRQHHQPGAQGRVIDKSSDGRFKANRPDDTQARTDAIVAAYKSGLSLLEVAAEFKCTKQNVHQLVKHHAPEAMRPPHVRRASQ